MVHKPILDLIENLRSIVPPEIDSFFFSNSGAEAVEGAIKLARQTTRKPNVIVFQGSFHGRTVGTMSLTTSKTKKLFRFMERGKIFAIGCMLKIMLQQ